MKMKPAPKDFREIKGWRSVIDVAKIKRENAERKQERLLKAVGDGVNALGNAIRDHKAKKIAAKILSEE
jgi:hypothetical protein